MGKIITPKQELILSEFARDPFTNTRFYFTGGTAPGLKKFFQRKGQRGGQFRH